MNLQIIIYGLSMPGTPDVRYVGKCEDMEIRFRDHIIESRRLQDTPKRKWIHSLLKQGLEPEIIILEVCFFDEWKDREKWWVNYYKELQGDLLTNVHPGGNGNILLKHSEETKKKLSLAHKGRKRPPFTEETRRKMSEAAKRRGPRGEEYLKNMSAAQKGKILSEEHRAKISAGVRTRLEKPNYRKNISEGLKASWAKRKEATQNG